VEKVTVAAPQKADWDTIAPSQPGCKPDLIPPNPCKPFPKGPLLEKHYVVHKIIEANQATHKLPLFGPHVLIVVLPSKGFTVDGGACAVGGGACHPSQSASEFWAVIPRDQPQITIAHEVFEASADPSKAYFQGWDEAVDSPRTTPAGCVVPPIHLKSFDVPSVSLTFEIPPATDNTLGGNCTGSGYTILEERHAYEVTKEKFGADYNLNHYEGWTLYMLQSYVLTNGEVRYNAVWRPDGWNQFERVLTDATYEQFVAENNQRLVTANNKEVWNLRILQSYVVKGEVRYNAVWRPGTVTEKPFFAETQKQFQDDYKKYTSEGWRLTILQSYVVKGEVRYNAVWRPVYPTADWRPGLPAEAPQFGVTFTVYENYYDIMSPLDYRLYILQPYVLSDGSVRYNALLRTGSHDEKQERGLTFAEYRHKYHKLYAGGWRIYILNAYVLPGDKVRYDAVWRLGTIDRPL
jgi:hypothetical protein